MIFTNPGVIAVIVLLVLCFLRVNVLLALICASVVAGLVSGMDIGTTMSTFISGCGTAPETAIALSLIHISKNRIHSKKLTKIEKEKM